MRIPVLVLGSLLALTFAAPGTQAGLEEVAWTVWMDDPVGDAGFADGTPGVEPRADLVAFSVAATMDLLYVQLRTAEGAVSATGDWVSTSVAFAVKVGDLESLVRVTGASAGVGMEATRPDGTPVPPEAFGVRAGSTAWDYEAWVRLDDLLGTPAPAALVLEDLVARSQALLAGDEGEAARLLLTRDGGSVYAAKGLPAQGEWVETEGPDLGGGPSVAFGPDGVVHVAYYIYSGDRTVEPGVYHATVEVGREAQLLEGDTAAVTGPWRAQRVGDFLPTGGRDEMTRTKVAVDGQGIVHILYSRCPDRACSPRYSYLSSATGFAPESPAAHQKEASTNAARDVPALAARGDRVVAAIPLTADRVLLAERTAQGWTSVHVLQEARVPRLALDASGRLHVAYFRPSAGAAQDREVAYAAEPGFAPRTIAKGVTAPGAGAWDTPEVDGSFAFALDPQGRPCFVWEGSRLGPSLAGQGFGCLDGDTFESEAVDLDPSHGNSQLAMRMAFDAAGNAHVASGYGGTDLYAFRTPLGTWSTQETDRHDMWDLAVSPAGTVVLAYTQPHGGTTVAVSVLQNVPQDGVASPVGGDGSATPPATAVPGPAAPLAMAAFALLAALARRRQA